MPPPSLEPRRKHLCGPRRSRTGHTMTLQLDLSPHGPRCLPRPRCLSLLPPPLLFQPSRLFVLLWPSSPFLLRLHLSAFPSRLFSWMVYLLVSLTLKEILVASSLQQALSLPTEHREGSRSRKGRRGRVCRMEKKRIQEI